MVNAIDAPSFVLGRRCDVLAWNSAMAALITDFGALPPKERNMARLFFLDEAVANLYPDFRRKSRDVVGYLRMDAGRHPDDPQLAELTVDYETLRLSDDPDQLLVTYTAEPGSPSEAALRILAAWDSSRTA